ncbi:MAG: acetyltransferase [Firmicutes bacterium]|nr:acetyltransferase [Bacillota bacterium]
MIFEILITQSNNADFAKIVKLLDRDLSERNGELQNQYTQYNKMDHLRDVVIVYADKVPVGCGALKEYDNSTVEIKRIFIVKEYRRRGLSKLILSKLEEIARQGGFLFALLETGAKQTEAIGLYKNSGYKEIKNYGPYIGNGNSVCMKKEL